MTRLAAALALAAAPAMAQKTTGNGAPSGTHYNLNILGKDTCAGSDLTGSNRHTIQVLLNYNDVTRTGGLYAALDKRNKIFLVEGDFQVIDGNACDGNGATFQLPAKPFVCAVDDPLCDDPTFQAYTVWARALGKPDGHAAMTTCAVDVGLDGLRDTADDVLVCSMESVTTFLRRNTGKSSFENVTKQLTTIYIDVDLDGTADTRVGIFDPRLYTYFWDYDNWGLRLAQLRFYPVGR